MWVRVQLQHLQPFVDYMNKWYKCIKFTSETEQTNTLSFLDIIVTHQNNQLKTSVYKKPTFSGVYTLWKLHWSIFQDVIDFHFVILLLFHLLWLHTILLGSWKTKRNFKKEHLSIWYYRTVNKNFFKQALCSKTSTFNNSKKGATNNFTLSWNHVIKFKVKTANFHSKFITTQASSYEKQGRVTIACLVTKSRGYRCVKNCTTPTKEHHNFLSFTMIWMNYNQIEIKTGLKGILEWVPPRKIRARQSKMFFTFVLLFRKVHSDLMGL